MEERAAKSVDLEGLKAIARCHWKKSKAPMLAAWAVHPLEILGDPSWSDVWIPNCPLAREDPSRPDHLAFVSHLPMDHLEHFNPLVLFHSSKTHGMLPFSSLSASISASQPARLSSTIVSTKETCAFHGLEQPMTELLCVVTAVHAALDICNAANEVEHEFQAIFSCARLPRNCSRS